MNLALQRATELSHQKETLEREFDVWRALTEEDKPLEKHHTQVRRITARLSGLLELATPAGGPGTTFEANERALTYMLGAHRLWNFFRSKLIIREVAWLRDDLMCADELAWECYRPARDRAVAVDPTADSRLKEPPLVFFSSEAEPSAQARDTKFLPEGITERDITDFGKAIFELPIPLIAIPWFQFLHLPSAAVIGHEVGHAVERDLGLQPDVEKLINKADIPDDRKPAWLAWRHEVFADVYGVLCLGPAAVLALMSYLVTDVDKIQKEELTSAKWGSYPTRFLRMKLNFELLRQLCLMKPTLDALAALGMVDGDPEQSWCDTYSFHLMDHFEKDLLKVIQALRDGPYPTLGNQGLPQVITFSESDVEGARDRAFDINIGNTLPPGSPLRHLFAAATLAYYVNPQAYAKHDGRKALIERIRLAIPGGVRSPRGTLTSEEQQQLEAADRQAGRELVHFFEAQT